MRMRFGTKLALTLTTILYFLDLSTTVTFSTSWGNVKSRLESLVHPRRRSLWVRLSSSPSPNTTHIVTDTVFSCIFCHHEKSVACKIDKKEGLGHLYCKICGQTFQTRANCTRSPGLSAHAITDRPTPDLTEPVDVFADWIDASEAASKAYSNNRKASSPVTPTAEPSIPRQSRVRADEEEQAAAAPPRRRFVQDDSDDD